MDNKKGIILGIVGFIFIGILSFMCITKETRYRKTDTPDKIITELKIALSNEGDNEHYEVDYEVFQHLFINKGKTSKEEFNELRKINTSSSSSTNYVVIRNTNNKVFLIQLTPTKINGEYKIESIKVVPDEMEKLFEDVK